MKRPAERTVFSPGAGLVRVVTSKLPRTCVGVISSMATVPDRDEGKRLASPAATSKT